MVIRPLRAGLEGFFEKNGKYLPEAGLGRKVMRGKGVCSVRLFLFFAPVCLSWVSSIGIICQ